MRKNSFWASTHPAWTGSGYMCKCGTFFEFKNDFNSHVVKQHSKEEAQELMSKRDFDKAFGVA